MKAHFKETAAAARPAPSRTENKATTSADMLKIAKLVVPIDFSRASLQAMPWARFIARAANAEVHLVHVRDFEYPGPIGFVPPVPLSTAGTENLLRRHLGDVAAEYRLEKTGDHLHIRTGRAFDQTCQVARELDADLIVTSTHGHTGWKRLFLGSTAERIVRHAPCPVLVARQPSRRRTTPPALQKMVVSLDFSRPSLKGLRYAVQVARTFGGTLTLLHVISRERHVTPEGAVMVGAPELLRQARTEAKTRLREMVQSNDLAGLALNIAIRIGFPEDEICAYAKKKEMDLIVTTTHGRTGFRHVLMGSVAEHIVRYAAGPVLVVPTRRGAKQ
jgi:nucleotide-binding universal stress UspA family protein